MAENNNWRFIWTKKNKLRQIATVEMWNVHSQIGIVAVYKSPSASNNDSLEHMD